MQLAFQINPEYRYDKAKSFTNQVCPYVSSLVVDLPKRLYSVLDIVVGPVEQQIDSILIYSDIDDFQRSLQAPNSKLQFQMRTCNTS